MQFAHEVIAVSNTLKQYAYESYGRVIRYIPNGANLGQYLPPSIIAQQFGLRKEWLYLDGVAVSAA